MRLSTLLDSLVVLSFTGDPSVEVSGISYNSQSLQPGELFVAVTGTHVDGHRFIEHAAARGAAGVVVERDVEAPLGLPVVRVDDTKVALAKLAAAFWGYPSQRLWLAGITGTDGKTTSTELTAQLMQHAGIGVGFMSTVSLKTEGERPSPNLTRQTTLEAVEIQRGFASMLQSGRRHAVLEVTSHALALNKVEGCIFDVAGVSNVTHEHLDFHGSWDNYLRAKGRLFEMLADTASKTGTRTAVLNRDDRSYDFLPPFIPSTAQTLTYGLHVDADVRADDVQITQDGAQFHLRTPWGSADVRLGLIGAFNVSNALLASTICLAQGMSVDQVAAGLAAARPVSGRMERINAGQPFHVIVDYAHTPDSLQKVLTMLRQAASGKRLLAVFGSAGERDVEKRPIMGRIAADLADFSVFTTEDPRFEDPMAIIEQIATGATSAGKREGADFLMVEDRRAAIASAFDRAQAGDIVLLAGKGHEQCIIVGNNKVPWDDRTVAEELARARYQAEPSRPA